MKKILTALLIIFLAQPAFSNSIFSKKENIEPDKTQAFFINIYANNDYDINEDFEAPVLANKQQIHYFSKKFEIPKTDSEDNFFISAKKTSDFNLSRYQVDTVELMSNYKYGKWNLAGKIYQETISGKNKYNNFIAIEPVFTINERFALFGGMKHSLTDNYDQTLLGIKYTPLKFKRVEFKVSVSNYTKQFSNYRNRLNFESAFKI